MSTWIEGARAGLMAAGMALLAAQASAASPAETARAALGRTATPAEVRAWDIDVRPDFQGLPKGSGTVSQGQAVWDAKCASCHGDFGESNEVFSPIVGGTTAEDIKRGRVASLTGNQPYRTTLMKVSTVSTLWDYIHRAMPWNAPRSLSPGEVYAVTAYLLNLGDIVPADFTLSDDNIAAVQQKMPNRNGMTLEHGLWPGRGQPDTRNAACMKDCAATVKVVSAMPAYARDAHGDLAAQQRTFGPTRGVATGGTASAPAAAGPAEAAGAKLAGQYQCTACHAADSKRVGPSFADIARKYRGQEA
ncbi:c-type cytochrome, partial [Cupriavidus basilensis]